jgi:hypothetical protein
MSIYAHLEVREGLEFCPELGFFTRIHVKASQTTDMKTDFVDDNDWRLVSATLR